MKSLEAAQDQLLLHPLHLSLREKMQKKVQKEALLIQLVVFMILDLFQMIALMSYYWTVKRQTLCITRH